MLLGLQLLIVLGNHFDLCGSKGVFLCCQRIGNCIEVVGISVDGEAVFFSLKIISAAIHGIHHNGIFFVIAIFVVDDQDALFVEAPADAAGGTQVTAKLIKVVTHGTCSTVTVVSHGLYDHSDTTGAIAFVGDGFIAVTAAGTGSLLQTTLDVVVGHIGSLGLGDNGGQTGVVGGIGNATAFFHCYDQFFCDLGKSSSTLCVLRALSFLNIMPFGMSGHSYLSLLNTKFNVF